MKKVLALIMILSSIAVFAASEDRVITRGPHNISATGGFNLGGFTFGAQYEYMYENSTGIGAYVRTFSKDTSTQHPANGVFSVGVDVGHHFYKKDWDFNLAPGFGIVNIQQARQSPPNPGDATTFGPSLMLSLVRQINPGWAFGFDYTNYWVWFDSNYQGHLRSDMSFKVRATF